MEIMQDVSVIVPSYNIEGTVAEVVRRCPGDYEVIVVDDGSSDRTRELAESTRAKVISHDRNMGKGQAMITGMKHASGDIVVFIDGDLQHIPEDIPRLVEKIADEGCDIVIGSRRLYDTKGMPFIRKASNKISTFLVRASLGVGISDTQSGFRAVRKDKLEQMGLKAKRFEIETEMLVKAAKMGLKICEVPISIVYQKDSDFHFSISDIFNFLKTIILR